MTEKKTEQRRVVSISLPPEMLERLDAHRWGRRLTRSGAIQDALKGYLRSGQDLAPAKVAGLGENDPL